MKTIFAVALLIVGFVAAQTNECESCVNRDCPHCVPDKDSMPSNKYAPSSTYRCPFAPSFANLNLLRNNCQQFVNLPVSLLCLFKKISIYVHIAGQSECTKV